MILHHESGEMARSGENSRALSLCAKRQQALRISGPTRLASRAWSDS